MILKFYEDPYEREPALCDAFRLIMSQTTVSSEIINELEENWVRDQVLERGKNVHKILSPLKDHQWDWEEFDAIRRVFREQNMWPTPWHQYRKAGEDPSNPMTAQRVKILATSLRTAAASRESARGDKYDRILENGWHIRCDSKVARPFVDHMTQTLRIIDWRTWPPFYPGDVSNIVADF